MRYMRFWLTAPYGSDEFTGLRGQYGDSGDDPLLYDIVREGDEWVCLLWLHLVTDPDAHAKREIARGDCFACMAAAELHAAGYLEVAAESER